MTKPNAKPEWKPLTDGDRIGAFKAMDGGLDGFLKGWGCLHFAKEIEARCKRKNAALIRRAKATARAALKQTEDK